MEVDSQECYVITEALVRLATNPAIKPIERELAKRIAYLINKEHEDTENTDE